MKYCLRRALPGSRGCLSPEPGVRGSLAWVFFPLRSPIAVYVLCRFADLTVCMLFADVVTEMQTFDAHSRLKHGFQRIPYGAGRRDTATFTDTDEKRISWGDLIRMPPPESK